MTQCTGCAAELPAEAKFCLHCGLPVEQPSCAACGEALPSQARFCMACGTPRTAGDQPAAPPPHAPVASRRTTSILFGDLVGFTTLSETRDQEEVRELLSRYFDECRQVIGRYGGTIEKFIGDAVMAVWGVPTAHEDDAERAVRAGLELVTAVAEFGQDVGAPDLAMRVGIVTGEVAVTVGATQQGMVAGDAVNTAARVQSVASPGSVWVDETTRLLTTAAITYADAGSHSLKGKAEPVPLWSVRAVVAAVGGAQRADGLESPLVGRDRELRLVKELFHQCEESGRPTLLVINGEAGVGKSRLRWEFEKYVDGVTTPVRWHSGRCVAYGEGVAYYALAEAVRGRLQMLAEPGGSAEESMDALLERGLGHYVPDADERSWIHDRLAVLLGVGGARDFTREDLFAAWVLFLERVGEGHPVTLIVDDAQHADDGLLTFVEHLLSTASFACFVMLLTRPGLLESRPALATHRQANVVQLPSLADRDVARMVEGLVAGLPDDVRDGLVARSEGLPLFAVETVRSLIDRDLVVPRGGQYVLAAGAERLDLAAIAAPASLQALISARLDALTPEQRTVVDRASVIGEAFASEALAGLCGELPDVPRVLEELLRLQILSRESSRSSAEFGAYRFVQSAVRQVAYGTLSRRDRKAMHLAVIARYESLGEVGDDTAAIRAQHYLDAVTALPGDDDVPALRVAAMECLRRAAERARTLGSPSEAARHLAAALALADDPWMRGRVGCELAMAEFDASHFEDAIAHAQEAQATLEELGDRVGAGYAVAVHGASLGIGLGQNERSAALVEPWWEELRDNEEAIETLTELGRTVMWVRHRLKREVHEIVEDRLRLAERTGSVRAISECYNVLAVHYATIGATSLSNVLLEASAELARQHHQLFPLTITLVNITAGESSRDLEHAFAVVQEARQLAARTGSPWLRQFAEANLAIVTWASGRWDALDELDQREEPSGGPLDETTWSMLALRAEARGSDWAGQNQADLDGDDQMKNSWRAFFGAALAMRSGDLSGALAWALQSTEIVFAETGVWDDLTHVWAPTVELALVLHDDQALRRLVEMVDDARVLPPGLLGHRAHVRALVAMREGRDEDVEPAMLEAFERYTAWGSPVYLAKAQANLGRWLLTQQRVEEGAVLLDAARTAYEQLGARRWLERLEDDLGASALSSAAADATIDRPGPTSRSPRE